MPLLRRKHWRDPSRRSPLHRVSLAHVGTWCRRHQLSRRCLSTHRSLLDHQSFALWLVHRRELAPKWGYHLLENKPNFECLMKCYTLQAILSMFHKMPHSIMLQKNLNIKFLQAKVSAFDEMSHITSKSISAWQKRQSKEWMFDKMPHWRMLQKIRSLNIRL